MAGACVYTAAFLLVFLAFPLYFFFRDDFSYEFRSILYTVGSVWLAVMLYLSILFLLSDFICFVFCRIKRSRYGLFRFKNKFRKIQVAVSSLLVLLVLFWGYYRFDHPRLVDQSIPIVKNAGTVKHLKVILVSDLHLGYTMDENRIGRYVERINALHPDMILIAGDLIDGDADYVEDNHLYEALNRLRAPLGIYACLGNHEYISNIGKSLRFLRHTKMTILRDSSVLVRKSFYVVGRDDKSNKARKPLHEILKPLNKNKPIILLDHQPLLRRESLTEPVDLLLSGHTHNGQIWPFNYIVKILFKDAYGYLNCGRTQMYTSSGLGLWGPPFRIGTQSEIVVLNIKFGKS